LRVATIVDVARLAGVSTSTVSHVVNGTRPVGDETAQRVLAAIASTGYRQDSLARALRRARTDSVGIVVSNVAQPAFAEMVRGVEREAAEAGFTLLLANSGEDRARESKALAALTARRVDGLIIAPAAHSSWRELDKIRRAGTPVVLMDRTSRLSADMVGVENSPPMRDLVLHLIDHGHRRIALAAGDLAVSTIAERRQGYFDALDEAEIKVNSAYVLTGSGLSEDSRADVRALFDLRQPPTAIVATSTETAAGVLEAAADLGLTPPADFAFGTFDGFAHADLFRPRITTITQPAYDIGVTAMQLLLRRFGDASVTRSKTVRLKADIAYRDSCGCIGAS
jgi:LacI family transcriptional regulator